MSIVETCYRNMKDISPFWRIGKRKKGDESNGYYKDHI